MYTGLRIGISELLCFRTREVMSAQLSCRRWNNGCFRLGSRGVNPADGQDTSSAERLDNCRGYYSQLILDILIYQQMIDSRKAVRMAPVGKRAGWAENPPRVMIFRDETSTGRFSVGYNQRVD